ncbi:mevalonate kinase [Neptuniibacter sp. 2_MG-2023]|jgi:mevalonate kinase|uniref:mevalonate kinase family protein n=1 Tax=Neptuniibacter sp. 2_MG-2023 TaxID=3062671 RepID=UPI0026E1D1D6|nr:mevalonate kinase [Neptuniibacter sp. 2_MG-2023]MDO6514267.1 mevalonate kinase [Neptuniibacter sp. 2_MG-2023]
MLSAKAPGKLILSGEHSVVYGAPAIALAVNHFVTASYTPSDSDTLIITSAALGRDSRTLGQLETFVAHIDQRFERFLSGELAVQDVLTTPHDLLYYAVLQSDRLGAGNITINSEIPTGAGMGSSAAVIASLLQLFESSSSMQKDAVEQQVFFQKVKYCERLQHGRGSAIDAAAVTYGGTLKVEDGKVMPLPIMLGEGWYYFHTGTPCCSTGETVSAVREQFASQVDLWEQFADVTHCFEQYINQPSELLAVIRSNHRLLQKIGVVPLSVSQLIERIEALGGAAKICGAGAHRGEGAGQVLVYFPEQNTELLSAQLGIQLTPLQQQLRGAHRA